MKLTNAEIFNTKEPLTKLLQERMPVKTSYGLAKLASKLNAQLMIIEKTRQAMFEAYGNPDPSNMSKLQVLEFIPVKDGNGEPIKDKDGNVTLERNPSYAKFLDEIKILFEVEIDIEIEVVTLPDTLEIEPAVLMALEKFVKM